MSESIKLSAFPESREEALTILYLQNQDLKGKTPEEIVVLYSETLSAIKAKFNEIRHQ